MKNFNNRSALFLGEIVLALLTFALCAAVCAGLLVRAYNIGNNSRELNQAVFSAQSAVEAFKSEQDMDKLAELLGGNTENGRCYLYYDRNWQLTGQAGAVFTLCITPRLAGGVLSADIAVSKDSGTVYSLVSAVYAGEGYR